jgi:hypothetical protein
MKLFHTLRTLIFISCCLSGLLASAEVVVKDVQPLAAQVRRVIETLDSLGSPLTPDARNAVTAELSETNAPLMVARLEAALRSRVLLRVHINPEMRVKAAPAEAKPLLVEGGWTTFLIAVENESGATSELKVASPQAGWLGNAPADQVPDRWMDVAMYNGQPLLKDLGGLPLEYRVIQLYSRDSGHREATLSFNIGQGTQDLGFRSQATILFTCAPARDVQLHILDEQGKPVTASLRITVSQGHVFPAQSKRLAPDFFFHSQIYRADGDLLHLPEGRYHVEFSRGPESVPEVRDLEVGSKSNEWRFQVVRWIDPSQFQWWSGDHHIHAAGCAHYSKPTEGVLASDMMRHVLGEDLKIGANLTWGPCFDYQKQFFRGVDDPVSRWPYLLHYDVEVSGFGSHESGHLCLLRLQEEIYPGGDSKNHWPKLGLNTLRWAKRQGALCGPAHSGWGLEVDTQELPNLVVPKYSGIGANENIVDVTHDVPGPQGNLVPAVDFLSTVDTPYVWELNMWYHTLNAGFRTRISGETDFPCIYSERVGLGRSYVKLEGQLTYEKWWEGIRAGRNYVSDGYSHLMEFQADNHEMGIDGSEVRLAEPKVVQFTIRAAARLAETPRDDLRKRKYSEQPYWHVERARLGNTREVAVELLENGRPIASKRLRADGQIQDLRFEHSVGRSGWYAIRILPSAHTNPIFITVGGKPIRASRKSVQWCLDGVEQCWTQKERLFQGAEIGQAREAYDHARAVYRQRLAECEVD